MPELVVLVDDNDRQVGTQEKRTVHHAETPLHRAFSAYVFSPQGRILVTQRAKTKVTWPGFWSNSFCGHPGPEETREEALVRRGLEELGVRVGNIEKAVDYRYRFEYDNVVENEICPVYVTLADSEELKENPEEVEGAKWMEWSEYRKDMDENKDRHSPWSQEQVLLLGKSPCFQEWLLRQGIGLR